MLLEQKWISSAHCDITDIWNIRQSGSTQSQTYKLSKDRKNTYVGTTAWTGRGRAYTARAMVWNRSKYFLSVKTICSVPYIAFLIQSELVNGAPLKYTLSKNANLFLSNHSHLIQWLAEDCFCQKYCVIKMCLNTILVSFYMWLIL